MASGQPTLKGVLNIPDIAGIENTIHLRKEKIMRFRMWAVVYLMAFAFVSRAGELRVDPRSNLSLDLIGASNVQWVVNGDEATATIFRESQVLATIAYKWTDDELRATWSPVGSESFAIEFTTDRFSLVLPDGQILTKRRNDATGSNYEADSAWVEHALAERYSVIAVVGDVLAEVEKSTVRRMLRRAMKPATDCIIDCGPGGGPGEVIVAPPDDGTGSGGGYYVVCQGASVWGEAYSLSSRKSELCDQAKQDANNQCSNQDCWGCCRTSDCNAACGVGDYFCIVATVEGTKCSRSVTWP